MIEAPEAANLAAQLRKTVLGKRITVVVPLFTPHKFTFFNGDPAAYDDLLTGKTIDRVDAFGGIVEIEAGGRRVFFSDGVNIRYIAPGEKLPAKHQFLIGFDDESSLVISVRMYGAIWAIKSEDEGGLSEYYKVARRKPQVLSGDFTEKYFMGLINAPDTQKKSAKAFLATEQAIPGLGNGVLQDILYNAGIHPKTKVADLSEERRKKVFGSVKSTLHEMADARGRNSETDLFGVAGGYVPFLSKDTLGEHCARCGDIIMKENYMGGAIYYCPGCQK